MNPTRRSIFESVQRVREGIDPHRNPSFGRHTFRIPEADFYALRKLYPGLSSTDPLEMSAAWEAFEKSPYSEPYRVGKIVRGIVKNGNLIK